ncbi:fimbria/pilus outer membrane usher protein [Methylonatrum kenyense]|uniref:fimbria/pilus outer membrane usher protein n=1 Tax=Methylonatrum kenyense TaxID=455253 RepID=UPI0020C14DB5|nr:fimbria/pilus outer membrane usher protein [Methylonatrum kenyense]MCK8516027.1 fimbria/pilus outer membrane usher protein [Methylonatrum kenyense]
MDRLAAKAPTWPGRKLLLLVAASLLGMNVAPADDEQLYRINVPLTLNDALVGEVLVEIDAAYDASVETARLMELLEGRLDRNEMSELRQQADDRELVPLDQLETDSFNIRFSQSALEVQGRIDTGRLRAGERRLSALDQPDREEFPRPEPASLGIDLSYAQDYVHRSDSRETGAVDPVVGLDIGANVGGFGGLNFIGSMLYDGRVANSSDRMQRRDMLLFHDDYDNAIRYSAGDIFPLTQGLQSSPRLGGVSIARQFGDIRPFQNIRPGGRQEVVLDSTSRVDVEVNGVIVDTLVLPAGRYNLSDFPLALGANDVRLFVEDDAGRREAASFSLFFDPVSLRQGVTLFSANVGLLEDPAGIGDIEYEDDLAFTGFIEHGFTDTISLGANSQFTDGLVNTGLNATTSTRFGSFQFDAAWSRADPDGFDSESGHALGIVYAWQTVAASLPTSINLVAERFSDGYRTLSDLQFGDTRDYSVLARVQTTLPANVGVTVGAQQQKLRPDGIIDRRVDVGISRFFDGGLSLFLNMAYVDSEFEDDTYTAFVGISYRFGNRFNARTTHNTRNSETRVQLDRTRRDVVNDVSGRVLSSRSDRRDLGEARGRYTGNRFEAEALTRQTRGRDGGGTTHESRLTASSGLAVTPSGVGVGRRAARGFVMTEPHDSLDGRRTTLDRGVFGTTAHSSRMGPAVAPVRRPYIPLRLDVDVEDLPLGYDIGEGRIGVLPGGFSGHHFVIGSDESRTLLGFIKDSDGEPFSLATGRLTRIDQEDDRIRSIFTNRTGRFVGERLPAGTFILTMDGYDGEIEIDIPEDAEGLIDVGTLQMP